MARLEAVTVLSCVLAVPLAGCPVPCESTGPEDCPQAPPAAPPPANAIRIWAGDQQLGPVSTSLADPIVVLWEANGAPHKNGNTTFSVQKGGGQLLGPGGPATSLNVTTGTDGTAGVAWRLGPSSGAQEVKVTFAGIPQYLTFTATGYGPPARVDISGGDGQSGETRGDLAVKPSVKVTDASGVQVPGMRVWFIPQDGGLPLDGEVATTGSFGVAQMPSRWQLGPAPGTQRLVARVLQGPTGSVDANLVNNPLTFTATATQSPPRNLKRNPLGFPEPQSGTAGQPVGMKPSVRVSDAGDYPLAGVSVRFAVASGGGSLGGALVIHESVTDANGVLTVPNWILGPNPGPNTVTATVMAQGAPASGVAGNPITFTANASAAPVGFTLAITEGNNQTAAVNTQVAVRPRVRVTDAQGAGVAGVAITWSLIQGAGSFLVNEPATDAAGYASLTYFAPTAVGAIRLRAATTDGRVSPQQVVFDLAGTAP